MFTKITEFNTCFQKLLGNYAMPQKVSMGESFAKAVMNLNTDDLLRWMNTLDRFLSAILPGRQPFRLPVYFSKPLWK